MKIWEILELPKTNSIPLIRKAFVNNVCAVKVDYFSEEGFLIMRDAYMKALYYARTGIIEDDEINIDNPSTCLTAEINGYLSQIMKMRKAILPGERDTVIPAEVEAKYDDIIRFYVSMMALHDDFYSRIEIDNWTSLFQTDILCNEKIINYLRLPVFASCSANPLLPHNVWLYLDLVFHWSDKSYSMPDTYKKEKAMLAIELDPKWDLGFSMFRISENKDYQSNGGNRASILPMWDHISVHTKKVKTIDYELYATYRRNARNAIIERNESEAERNFVKASGIFDKDPDLFVIYFEYLRGIKDDGKLQAIKDLHLMILNRLLEFFPDHFMFLLCRAEINAVRQHPSLVIVEYKKLMQQFPESLMVLLQLSDVYHRAGQESAARKCIKNIEKMYPSVQARLLNGRCRSKDPVAIHEQHRLNEQVMKTLEKRRNYEKENTTNARKKVKVS